MKTINIKLKFGAYKHCLYAIECGNFIKDQPDRFELLEGKKCETGTMFFCNTYLEAQFVMALEKGIGLYSDELGKNDCTFVVCSKKRFGPKNVCFTSKLTRIGK